MSLSQLDPAGIARLRAALPSMPENQKRKTAELLKRYQEDLIRVAGKKSFLDFVKHVYPGYLIGPHHRKLARIFEDIASGAKKRVIVNIAPGLVSLNSFLTSLQHGFWAITPRKRSLWPPIQPI